jgi:hypothetical protein
LYEQSLATQIAGFENVAMSMLSVFQAMTLTNWSFTMYRTMDFLSPAVVIYWFVMIIFGAYFVVSPACRMTSAITCTSGTLLGSHACCLPCGASCTAL